MRFKFFYGWWILLALFFISAAGSVGINTMPLLNATLQEEYGWTSTEVTGPASMLFILVAIFSPIIGFLLDRFNTKLLLACGAFALVLVIAYYSVVQSIFMLFVFYALFSLAHVSTGIVPGVYLITKWFEDKRGLAIGVFLVGSSFGGIIFPQIVKVGMRLGGWEQAVWLLVAAMMVLALLPLLLIRNRPSDLGLLPDGKAKEAGAMVDKRTLMKGGFTLAEALSSKTFYILLFVTAAMWFCILGLIQHLGIFLKDIEVDVAYSANALSWFFACSIIGKVLFGWLSDRYSKLNIMLLATFSLILGGLFLSFTIDNTAYLYPSIIVFGIGYSGTFTMLQLLVAEYYSGASYGKILGVFTTVDTFAGSAGVLVLATIRDHYGSYQYAFLLLVGICFFASLCVLALRKPSRFKETISMDS